MTRKPFANFHAPEPKVNNRISTDELMEETKKAFQEMFCFPTHCLPERLRNRRVDVQKCEQDYLNGYRVPVMSIAEIEKRL